MLQEVDKLSALTQVCRSVWKTTACGPMLQEFDEVMIADLSHEVHTSIHFNCLVAKGDSSTGLQGFVIPAHAASLQGFVWSCRCLIMDTAVFMVCPRVCTAANLSPLILKVSDTASLHGYPGLALSSPAFAGLIQPRLPISLKNYCMRPHVA